MFHLDLEKIFRQLAYNPEEPLIFNSGLFLFLFTGFALIYFWLADRNAGDLGFIRNRERAKLIFVTLFSLYFYYKSSGLYFVLLLVATVVDFNLARLMDQRDDPWERKALLIASLTVNLGLLAYFKYTNFFLGTISALGDGHYRPLDIFLPVGISFFTFQSLSYSIDVYRRHLRPVDSILDYAFYLSFFPQLVAGPIVRAADFLPQINRPTIVTPEMTGRGVYLIATGLFKKAVISDYISVNFVDRVFDQPTFYTGLENLFAVYGYALQIYCDFSGYSDMAIGIALLLGFHFNVNFNSPYRALNITDFWRRWHISLSTWLRDYLYISLGGNRHGKVRTYINLMITMLLGGLWHGASWKFVIWGGLHGAALAVHKMWSGYVVLPERRWLTVLSAVVTFHFVCFCWIFFRAADMTTVGSMLGQITSNFSLSVLGEFIAGYQGVFILMVLGFGLHFVPGRYCDRVEESIMQMPVIAKAACLVAVIVVVMQTKSAGVQPFIYFQF